MWGRILRGHRARETAIWVVRSGVFCRDQPQKGSSAGCTRRRRGRLPCFLRRPRLAELEQVATAKATVAAAPWLGSQVPWCRHLGGGMRGPQCVRAAMLSLWGHLSRLPVPPWGFSSAHPRGHLCSLSRDYPVWDPAWALGVPLPGPRAGHGTPGFSFWPPRSALACLLPRSGRRRAGERGAGGRDHPFFRPGAHGRGPSF